MRRRTKLQRREQNIRRKYGLSSDQYQSLLIEQDSKCTICGTKQEDFKRKLSVDHDHITGQIRGLLCFKCNSAIGLLNDDPELIKKAYKYIKSWKS